MKRRLVIDGFSDIDWILSSMLKLLFFLNKMLNYILNYFILFQSTIPSWVKAVEINGKAKQDLGD